MISIKKEGVRLVINVGKLKFKLRYKKQINYPINKQLISELTQNLRENTVLMLEANDFHGEIMPGYIQYLLDLGYNVDLLTTEKHQEDSTLCRLQSDKLQQYYTNISTMETILQTPEIMDKYAGLFVNSMCLFRKDRAMKSPALIYKYFKGFHKPKNGFVINVCHIINNIKTKYLKENNCVVLAKASKDLPIVNPCTFGDIRITSKNETTTFLISGDGSKNFQMVADSVQKLRSNGIENFKVYVTGRYKHNELTEQLKPHVEFLGFVSFEELYSLAEKADFIIPCLDPDNKKHLWYIENGTSGAFQMSYGFGTPMLIAEKFAPKALVDNTSAIVYKNNADLYNAMTKAIRMSAEDYNLLQAQTLNVAKSIYDNSKKNVEMLIEKSATPKILMRAACLGFLTFKNINTSKYDLISLNKQRVDYIQACQTNPNVRLKSDSVKAYPREEAMLQERWATQETDIFAQKNVKFLVMDSFAEMADKRFRNKENGMEICAGYAEIKKESDFFEKYEDLGLIDLDTLENKYRKFFSDVINQYGEISILYLVFSTQFETRDLYISRRKQILEILKKLQTEFKNLYVLEPKILAQNPDGQTYHYSDKTYKNFAEKIAKETNLFETRANKNLFEYIFKKEITMNKKQQIILFSIIKITY